MVKKSEETETTERDTRLANLEVENQRLLSDMKDIINARPAAPFATYNAAMARAQSKMRTVGQDREVEVETLKGGKYAFKYATLAATHDAIREALTSEGFSWMQFPTVNLKDGVVEVRTEINHACGESKSGVITLPLSDKSPRGVAGIISYARRYLLNAMAGVASREEADHDDEAPRFEGMEAPPSLPPEPPAHLRPRQPPASPPPRAKKVSMIDLAMNLQVSKTKAELDIAATAVSAAKSSGAITPQQREDLLHVYKKRGDEIARGVPDTITGNDSAPEPGSEG